MSVNVQALGERLPSLAIEQFGLGTKLSDGTIDVGAANAVLIVLTPQGTAIANLTVFDSPRPGGPFTPSVDPGGSVNGLTNLTQNRYLVTVNQRYVKVQLTVTAGSWLVQWSAVTIGSRGEVPQALSPSGTTGPIPASNTSTQFTIPLGSLQSTISSAIFDARQALVIIANNNTGQNIYAATLVFTDTTPNGVALETDYALPFATQITNNTQARFIVLLKNQALRTMALRIAFVSAPTQGTVDVQVYLQGAGGGAVDPIAGRQLTTAAIDVNTGGANTIVAAANAGQRIHVVSYVLVAGGTVTVTWLGGGGGSPLSGPIPLVANSGLSIATSVPSDVLATAAGQNLALSLSAAVQVSGHLTYWVEQFGIQV